MLRAEASVTMSHLVGILLLATVVVGLGRTLPLAGPRRLAVLGVRLAALACVLLALQGASCLRRAQQPRHVVYLVDVSASMDAGKQAWAARRLASLDSLRPPQMTRTVIAFAGDARTVSASSHAPLIDPQAIAAGLRTVSVDRSATNLEAGLLDGLAELSQQTRGRVILLSDGRQTQGNVERIIPHLRREGLEVYPIAVPPSQAPQVSWEQLITPPVVRQGASISAKLVLINGASRAQPIQVAVQVGGVTILQRRLTVQPGWQVASVEIPTLKSGTFAFDVSVADAGAAAMEQRSAVVEVEGPPRVLWVQERASALPLLATALKRRQFEVSVVEPDELPTDAGALLDYDAVLLFQVPKSSVTARQAGALQGYVERLGGGLVMVGLAGCSTASWHRRRRWMRCCRSASSPRDCRRRSGASAS